MSATRSICDNKAVVYLLSVLAIVLWGMSYIWSDRLIALGVPISYFVPLRIFVAGIILLLFNILTKNFRPIARKDIWKFLLLALFEPLIYFFCETYGIKETGSPTISAMSRSAPLSPGRRVRGLIHFTAAGSGATAVRSSTRSCAKSESQSSPGRCW